MPRLNQIVAIEKDVRSRTQSVTTGSYHRLQKSPLLSGIVRKYQKRDEEGDDLPGESTRVQVSAERELDETIGALRGLFDTVATKDVGNTIATADVVINGVTLAAGLPVSFLLWLERQLVDLHTYVAKMPIQDPADQWTEVEPGIYKTEPVRTTRTKKIPKNHVKAWPDDKHPNIVPQVETFFEDVLVGYWETVKLSGAMPAEKKAALVARVEALQQAVKFARTQANVTEVERQRVGAALLDYVVNG